MGKISVVRAKNNRILSPSFDLLKIKGTEVVFKKQEKQPNLHSPI